MKKTTYAIIALILSGFVITLGFILATFAMSEPVDYGSIVTEDIFDQVTEDVDVVAPDDTVWCETPDTGACNQADTIQ